MNELKNGVNSYNGILLWWMETTYWAMNRQRKLKCILLNRWGQKLHMENYTAFQENYADSERFMVKKEFEREDEWAQN